MISIFKDYKLNHHENSPFIHYVQSKNITIYCEEDIIYDIDGEEGTTFPIHIRVIPKALNIIVP